MGQQESISKDHTRKKKKISKDQNSGNELMEAVAEPGLSRTPGQILSIVVTKTRRPQTHSSKDT